MKRHVFYVHGASRVGSSIIKLCVQEVATINWTCPKIGAFPPTMGPPLCGRMPWQAVWHITCAPSVVCSHAMAHGRNILPLGATQACASAATPRRRGRRERGRGARADACTCRTLNLLVNLNASNTGCKHTQIKTEYCPKNAEHKSLYGVRAYTKRRPQALPVAPRLPSAPMSSQALTRAPRATPSAPRRSQALPGVPRRDT